MDKKSSKKNKSGKVQSQHEMQGIDWDLYEEMYKKTGFAKQFGKEKNQSDKKKLPGRTVQLKGRKPEGNEASTRKDKTSTVKKNEGFKKESIKKDAGRKTSEKKDFKKKDTGSSKKRMETKKVSGNKTTASGEPICAHYRVCGGCHLQGMDYQKQLAEKEKRVKQLLGKFGKVESIIGMKDPYHYRNKVNAEFDRDRRGNIISGIYEEGTHNVIAVEQCIIQNKKANDIINSIRDLLKSFKIKTYDEDTGYGLLRRVLVRTGYHTGEIMVVLVLGSPILPSKNNFVKALRKLHPEITTVVINVNDKQTSMILGDRETTIYGKGYIEDILCGLRFRISPKSFYQVNPTQTEVLYNKAIAMAGLNGTQKVIDAYCGIGTIGMIASKHAKEVIGVELNPDAVRDARANAKLNNIKNISFYNNDAGKFMVEMAEQNEHADVVIMDPPRAGSDETFMDCVAKLAPEKVVYVSCNPETLARDLEYMQKKGYQVKKMIPVDMFPFTNHVETVCLLSRKAQ